MLEKRFTPEVAQKEVWIDSNEISMNVNISLLEGDIASTLPAIKVIICWVAPVADMKRPYNRAPIKISLNHLTRQECA